MISLKFPKQLRTLPFFSTPRFFFTVHHTEKDPHHAPKPHSEGHGAAADHHHDSHSHSTVEPYTGPIHQTQYVKIFPNEENEHFTRSLYNVFGHL